MCERVPEKFELDIFIEASIRDLLIILKKVKL